MALTIFGISLPDFDWTGLKEIESKVNQTYLDKILEEALWKAIVHYAEFTFAKL